MDKFVLARWGIASFCLILFSATMVFPAELVLPVKPAPDIAWVDGVIVFRKDYVPTPMESALANSGIKFKNFSDFYECSKSTSSAQDKIDDLPPSEVKKKADKIQAIKDAM